MPARLRRVTISKATLVLLATLALAGCVTTSLPDPVNQPLTIGAPQPQPPGLNVDGDVVALAFSGGGARAAAFSFGVLEGLREMPRAGGGSLLDHVMLVSGVSGGSIAAAYFGQLGVEGLDGFRAAYLDKDWASELHTSLASPPNWVRAYDGALNERDRLADWLNAEIYQDGTIADLWRPNRPRIWINATDLYSGVPFAFDPVYFDALCSDLAHVRIADAVAASMAVPVVFRPVVVESYAGHCNTPLPPWVVKSARDKQTSELMRTAAHALESYRDPTRVRYLHLVDGGLADNFGLSSLILMRRAATTPYAPFSPRDAVRVRRMTFLVVNAEQSSNADWALTQKGPGGAETLAAAMDGAINVSKRRSYDAFRDTIAAWELDVRQYRCALPKAKVASLAVGIKNWDCRNVHFAVDMISFADLPSDQSKSLGGVETRVSLPAATIDALIAGGKKAVKINAVARSLAR
jgi:NTE family protein